MDHSITFSLRNGSTRNIADAPMKLLGTLIAVSANKTKNAESTKLECNILSTVKNIDERPIWGEYKVRIWKNDLVSSLHF